MAKIVEKHKLKHIIIISKIVNRVSKEYKEYKVYKLGGKYVRKVQKKIVSFYGKG